MACCTNLSPCACQAICGHYSDYTKILGTLHGPIEVVGIHSKQSHYGSCTEQHQQKLSACQGKLILLLLLVVVESEE